MRKLKKSLYIISVLLIAYFLINAIRIYSYSFSYSEKKSDVAIVLGAGTNNGKISPVFRERINHSVYIYKKGIVNKIIFTGGYGNQQLYSDSRIAKNYAVKFGVPEENIIIEEKSKFTYENISESKKIMDSLNLKTALIVSDPIHMKRSIKLAKLQKIDCLPSPTQTSMYKSSNPKLKLLLYESFYFSLREPLSIFH